MITLIRSTVYMFLNPDVATSSYEDSDSDMTPNSMIM